MTVLTGGHYRARRAAGPDDLLAAQRLRGRAFHGQDLPDRDAHDPLCEHMLIEDMRSGLLVCCFRFLPLASGAGIGRSYSAQYYNLSALESFAGPMIEMGRFCVEPGVTDPDILRVAWGAMAAEVDARGVELLFGCASFAGTDAHVYSDAFAMLTARYLAPRRWLPRVKAPEVIRFAQRWRSMPDIRTAMLRMPPLLRTYLSMGGWVSDHAVVDAQMNTLHVFTGVEIAAIPPARKKLLRAVAG